MKKKYNGSKLGTWKTAKALSNLTWDLETNLRKCLEDSLLQTDQSGKARLEELEGVKYRHRGKLWGKAMRLGRGC